RCRAVTVVRGARARRARRSAPRPRPPRRARAAASNPQMRARGFFEAETHPVTGTHELPGLPMRFSAVERRNRSLAPTLGHQTDEVLREVLGLGDEAIAELRAEGIVGERPAGA